MKTAKQYPIAIEKKQWDRIQKAAGNLQEHAPQGVTVEYVQKLIQQSKDYTKNWPDSIEGILAKNKMVREQKKNKEKEIIKTFKEQEELKKKYNAAPIEKAKKMLFDRSGYGRQLISAVLESKVIEEREAQIKFKTELQEKAKALERKMELQNTLVLGEGKTKEEIFETNKAFAEINKATFEQKKLSAKKADEEEKLLELEEARKMKEFLEMESHAMDACKIKAIEDLKQCTEDKKRIEKEKAEREAVNDAVVETWKNSDDRIRCMMKKNMAKIIKETTEGAYYQTNYVLLKNIQEEKQKVYDTFIEKGVNTMENLFIKDDETEIKNKLKVTHLTNENLKLSKCKSLQNMVKKDHSVRSSLSIPKRDSKIIKAKRIAAEKASCKCQRKPSDESCLATEISSCNKCQRKGTEKSFLTPSNKLITELRMREQEKSPFTGTKQVHEQFAKHAREVLDECSHKYIVKKVIDKYRKDNNVTEESLPI